MLDPSWSSMAASSSSSLPSSVSTSTATLSASTSSLPAQPAQAQQQTSAPSPSQATANVATDTTTTTANNNNNNSPDGMNSSMVSESSGSTSSWIQVEQTMTQVTAAHTPTPTPHDDNKTPSPISDDIPSTTTSAIPSPSPSPYPSLPHDEDTWSHDDLSLGDEEGLASSISSLSSLQGNHHDHEHEHEHDQHVMAQDDTQQHAHAQQPQATAASLGASALGVSSITSSWHDNFQSLHDATNDHDSPPLSTTSSPLSSGTSHSSVPSPRRDMTSSTTSYVNVSTPTLVASTLAASTLAATAMATATSMVQSHVTSVDVPSPSLYPQSDHDSIDDHPPSTGSGAILIATMCGLFLGLMASSYYFSRRSYKRGMESQTTIMTLQRMLSEKDAELKRLTELFQQYLATPIVVRLTER